MSEDKGRRKLEEEVKAMLGNFLASGVASKLRANASKVEEAAEISMIPGSVELFAFDSALLGCLFFEEV
jgi:hypothetical protein